MNSRKKLPKKVAVPKKYVSAWIVLHKTVLFCFGYIYIYLDLVEFFIIILLLLLLISQTFIKYSY